jgi:hypothetical protein
MTQSQPEYEVVSPLGVYVGGTPLDRKRIGNLNGARIAILWNKLFRGDEYFEILQRHVNERFDNVTFVGHENFGNFHGADDLVALRDLPAQLRAARVDAAIVGVGA